jgi:AraC family transcriptional regulator
MDIRVESWDVIRVASVRHVGPYDQCQPAWEALMAWAGPKGLLGPDSRMLGICHDNPQETPPEKIRYDACISVGPDVAGDGNVAVQEIPACTWAIARHEGSYSNLAGVYEEIYERWIPANGYVFLMRPPIEVYLNCPGSTPEQELLTEICVPVRLK